jgi:hypothetical protein
MPYTNSQAFTPAGTLFGFKATAASMTWLTVGEAKKITISGRKLDTADVTNLLSAMKEFVPTIADPGMFEIEYNWIPSDTNHQALETLYEAQSAGTVGNVPVMIQIPLAGGTTWVTITGVATLTENLPDGFDRTKPITAKASFKVSNGLTFAWAASTAVLTADAA